MAQSNQSPGSIKGVTPLAYTGTVPNMVFNTRRPTARDVLGIELGTWWIILKKKSGAAASDPSREVWILVGNSQQTASWKKMNGGSGPTEEQSIKVTVIDAVGAGLFTFDPGMYQVQVEVLGGGGGGAGVQHTIGGGIASSGGGGGGAYSKRLFSLATVGSSQNFIIGVGGAGSWGFNKGSDGGATSFGAFINCTGGYGSPRTSLNFPSYGGLGGTATGGNININGNPGFVSFAISFGGGYSGFVGIGANSQYGSGGAPSGTTFNDNGHNGLGNGSGGSGCIGWLSATTYTGGNGTSGLLILTEYLS